MVSRTGRDIAVQFSVSGAALLAGWATREPPAPVPASAPRAAIGAWGVDLTARDMNVKPGDDFFRHVNGAWMASNSIPADRITWGTNDILAEKAERDVREIIEDAARSGGAPGSNAQKVSDYYNAYCDQAAVDAAGLAPIQRPLAEIAELRTHEDVIRFIARSDVGMSSPIDLSVQLDEGNPDRYLPNVSHGGLGLPEREYYRRTDGQFPALRTAYAAKVEEMLGLIGESDAHAKAQAVLSLETQIAERHWPIADRREREKVYNLRHRSDVRAINPRYPWDAQFEAAGLNNGAEVVVAELSAMQPLSELFLATPVATWKSYMAWHYVRVRASVLSKTIDDANFDFYGKTLNGQQQQRERWKRAIQSINNVLGEAVGQIYVQRHFPPAAKQEALQLVENMRRAYGERIRAVTWMSEETKQRALEKLALFRPKIGYPDKWEDYSAMDIRAGDAFGNAQRARIWQANKDIARLGRPSDRDEWFMNPHAVNAYYNPPFNEIVFPAGYLQPPLFDPNADAAVNYGGIGGVIGHEMGHGFDDQGAKSDGHGVLRDWWSPDDVRRFRAITDRLAAQYDAFEPLPGLHVNGRLTLGENIGDNGGLQVALHAYHLSLGGREAPVLDGLTGDQRFFLARAQGRRQLIRDQALRNQLLSDPHSPNVYRINGVVRNMDAWYTAFNVQPGDALYLSSSDRVQIW